MRKVSYNNAKSFRSKTFRYLFRKAVITQRKFPLFSAFLFACLVFLTAVAIVRILTFNSSLTPEEKFIRGLHKPPVAQYAREHVYTRSNPLHVKSLLPGVTRMFRHSHARVMHGKKVNTSIDLVKTVQHRGFFTPGHVHDFYMDKMPFINETVKEFRARIRPRLDFSKTEYRKNTIFVSIPSYRDHLCTPTIRDLFDKAEHPELLYIGVCDQYDPEKDTPCEAPEEWADHVRFVRVDYRISNGPTFARYLISKLWDGEEFFFSIDSHTGFMYRWDSVLVDMMRHLPDHSLVTHYPVADVKSELLGITEGHLPWLCKGHFQGDGLVIQECGECHKDNHPKEYACTSVTIGAGFYFGHSEMLYIAPFDRYLDWLFQGEELILSARLWTGGWEFFSPPTNVVHHVYGYRKHSVFSEGRHKDRQKKHEQMMQRVWYLLAQRAELPEENHHELEDLGMGNVRSLGEYYEFMGLDLKNRTWENRCFSYYDYAKKQWIPTGRR